MLVLAGLSFPFFLDREITPESLLPIVQLKENAIKRAKVTSWKGKNNTLSLDVFPSFLLSKRPFLCDAQNKYLVCSKFF